MFGFGFFELVVVLIVAVIFLGPDKLPGALVEMVKYWRLLKRTLEDAKGTLDKELDIAELKSEALSYKKTLENSLDKITGDIEKIKDDVSRDANLPGLLNNLSGDGKNLVLDNMVKDLDKLEDDVGGLKGATSEAPAKLGKIDGASSASLEASTASLAGDALKSGISADGKVDGAPFSSKDADAKDAPLAYREKVESKIDLASDAKSQAQTERKPQIDSTTPKVAAPKSHKFESWS